MDVLKNPGKIPGPGPIERRFKTQYHYTIEFCHDFFFLDVREEFRLFLRTEHSEENLDFWLICEEYKNTSDQSALAKIIFKHFINSGAPREVSFSTNSNTLVSYDQDSRFSSPSGTENILHSDE